MERINRNASQPVSRRGRAAEPIEVGKFRYNSVKEAAELLAKKGKLSKASALNNLYRYKRAAKEYGQAAAGVEPLFNLPDDTHGHTHTRHKVKDEKAA